VKLTADAFRAVSDALCDAFPNRGDFERLARCLDGRLQDIAGPNDPIPDLALALIEHAESADCVDRLVDCAKTQNPDNRMLAALGADALTAAAAPAEVVDAGAGADTFKRRLKEALGNLDTDGMHVLAGHELAELLQTASDDEAETLFLALLGTVRGDRPDGVVAELAPVVSDYLRRRLADGKRTELNLARARLRRIDLSGLDLHETDIAFADLRHADLTNTNLWRSRGYAVHVSKAGLSRSNLEEARWRAAVAQDARFHDCRMVSVFLKEADLNGAEFQRSRLQGAHLEGANLTGARFEQANLADAYFSGATIDAAAARSISRAKNWDKARFDSAARELIAAGAGP
jgi:uncharacterized protein YjbI with pentapeptide repeats